MTFVSRKFACCTSFPLSLSRSAEGSFPLPGRSVKTVEFGGHHCITLFLHEGLFGVPFIEETERPRAAGQTDADSRASSCRLSFLAPNTMFLYRTVLCITVMQRLYSYSFPSVLFLLLKILHSGIFSMQEKAFLVLISWPFRRPCIC